jgi:hypothetical protein
MGMRVVARSLKHRCAVRIEVRRRAETIFYLQFHGIDRSAAKHVLSALMQLP